MSDDVRESVAEYLAHGWKVCRIQPGSKGPRDKDWNEKEHHIRSVEGFPVGYGVGLLHAWSRTMALDIDHYAVARDWLAERGVDLDSLILDDATVRISSGREGRAKLLYSCDARAGKSCAPYTAADKNGKPRQAMALDFRCATGSGTSQQDALPPTIHPGRGMPYVWEFGMCADWRMLPELPAALEAIWDEISPRVATAAPPETVAPSGEAPERIQAWLRTQNPDMCRDDWVKVGAKLHAEYQGSTEGFNIWCAWSALSDKWGTLDTNGQSGSTEALTVWRSFKLDGRHLATLEADIRQMPASPEEFAPVVDKPATEKPAGDYAAEGATERETREMLQNYVALQTGGAKTFFLLPGHPTPSIAKAAGIAGVEMSAQQLCNVFGPWLPPISIGKNRMAPQDASSVMRNAKWRREVHRVCFNPGGGETYVDVDGHTYLNSYKPIQVEPVKPREREIEPLLWLLRRVHTENGEPVFAQWLLRLYAYVLQNPGIKVKWAPILYSQVQGTGKTTLMQTLPSLLFGKPYVTELPHTILRERFAGSQLDATWWVSLAEMKADQGKVDAKMIANKLKPWITDDYITVEKKGVDSYKIRNHIQLTAQTNHRDALFLDRGEKDRRWLAGEIQGERLTTAEMAFLDPLFGGDHARDPRAAGWLKWYFLEKVNLTAFKPDESPPDTVIKTVMYEESDGVWDDAVFEAQFAQLYPFNRDLILPVELTKSVLIGKSVSIAQTKALLEKVGCRALSKRFEFARSVYCQRYADQWGHATPAEVKKHLADGSRPFQVDDGDDLI